VPNPRVAEVDVWSRETINAHLRLGRNRDLATFYFGDGHAIDGTVRMPFEMAVNAGRDIPLTGRADLADRLAEAQDLMLVGLPGTGRTPVAMELPGVRFLNQPFVVAAGSLLLRRR
jgi:hypothetical protein